MEWPDEWKPFQSQLNSTSDAIDKILNQRKKKVEFISKWYRRTNERTYPEDPARVTFLEIEYENIEQLIGYLGSPEKWPNLRKIFLSKKQPRPLVSVQVSLPLDCVFKDGKYDKELSFRKRILKYYTRETLFIQDEQSFFPDGYITSLEEVIGSQSTPYVFVKEGEGRKMITPLPGYVYEGKQCVFYDPMEDYSKWDIRKAIYVTDDISSLRFIEICENLSQMVKKPSSDFQVLVPDAYVGENETKIAGRRLEGPLDPRIRIICKKQVVFSGQQHPMMFGENYIGEKTTTLNGKRANTPLTRAQATEVFPKKKKQIIAPKPGGVVSRGDEVDLLKEETN